MGFSCNKSHPLILCEKNSLLPRTSRKFLNSICLDFYACLNLPEWFAKGLNNSLILYAGRVF